MNREIVTAIIVAVAVLVFAAMIWGWRRRSRRDAGLIAPTELPALDAGASTSTFDGFYVATTRHDQPLDRLAIRHLAFRGRVRAAVRPDGVELAIPGEPIVFLPTSTLVGVGRATWTIDRVVERDGLAMLAWRVTPDDVADSYLRLPDSADAFVTAVQGILPTVDAATDPTSTPSTGSDA